MTKKHKNLKFQRKIYCFIFGVFCTNGSGRMSLCLFPQAMLHQECALRRSTAVCQIRHPDYFFIATMSQFADLVANQPQLGNC